MIGPLRQGDFVRGSFRDIETNADTEIEVLDPLPAGGSIARSGLLEGRAEEAGTYAFRLRATRDDGSVTERAHGLAVYAPVEATCGSTVPFATAQGRDEANPAFGVDRDVAGFAVVETDWADHEGLSYEIAFDEGVGTVGVVDAATAVVGPVSAVREYSGEAVTVELTPQSWPVAAYSQAWPQARLVIYAPDRAVSGTVTVTCDDGPRPARYALPVLTPGQAGSFALPAVGGDPPYTWEAKGLPASVTLSSEGVLESDGTDFGAVTVDVTVSDAGGPGPTVPMPLWSSIRALCGPDAAILTCDGASSEVSGTFDDTVQTTVCIDPAALDASDWAYVQVTRLGDGFFPDVELLDYPDLTVRRGTFSRIGLVRGFNSYEFGLEHYAGLPFPFAVAEAFEDAGGSWRACLTCGTGPNPGFGAAGCPEP